MQDWLSGFFEMNPDAVEIEEEPKVAKKYELDMFKVVLPAADKGDKDFYKTLTPEEKKEFGMWKLMRSFSSAQNHPEHHLMMVNDLVNSNFNSLVKHPELQWKLLALCGTNRKEFHPWIAPPKGVKKNKIEQALIDIYPLLKDDDIELMLSMNTRADLELFFKENGYDDKTIKEIFKGEAKGK